MDVCKQKFVYSKNELLRRFGFNPSKVEVFRYLEDSGKMLIDDKIFCNEDIIRRFGLSPFSISNIRFNEGDDTISLFRRH